MNPMYTTQYSDKACTCKQHFKNSREKHNLDISDDPEQPIANQMLPL